MFRFPNRGPLWAGLVLACLLQPAALAADDAAQRLTLERIVSGPPLEGVTARGVKFAPDGRRVTYLKPKDTDPSVRDLWMFEVETGTHRLLLDSTVLSQAAETEAERLRRERQRIRETGIVDYAWNDDGTALLVPQGGDLYLLSLADGQAGPPRRLTETPDPELDAKFAPDGHAVSFVRSGNLFVLDLETGRERALTKEAGDGLSFGTAEFIAQEEMGRHTGYWWSPDSRRIAFTRVDERAIPVVNRYDYGPGGVVTVPQRYPFAGGPNAAVELKVIELGRGQVTAVDLGPETDIYLARVDWRPDSGALAVQRLDRGHTRLDILLADAATGKTAPLLTETAKTWIELTDDFRFLADGRFLWSSEKTGFRHLYLHGADGRELRALTVGVWVMAAVEGVDESTGRVIFGGFKDGQLERHIYAVNLEGGPESIVRLSAPGAWHEAIPAPKGGAWLNTGSSPEQPPQMALRDKAGGLITWIAENAVAGDHPYAPYRPAQILPSFGTLAAADGTPLHWTMLKPPTATADSPAPAIVYTYAGPTAQLVARRWGDGTWHLLQVLAQRGYVVFVLDNRGSENRGRAFADHLYRAFGTVEVTDQVAGARYLQSLPFVAGDRIGLYGHSYGGYATIMNLLRAPDVFAAGVAGAPVTDWRLYDTFYTEKYLGLPQEGDVYAKVGAFLEADLARLADPLLLIHGMADDNVFFDNTVTFAHALQQAGKPFEMMVYPGERHSFFDRENRLHAWTTIVGFFDRHLRPPVAGH